MLELMTRRTDPGPLPSAATARLEVHGLSVAFGGLRALDAVDLHVAPGRIVSLIGPNGAGKTTLFNVISGFQKPTSGRVLFDGQPLDGRSAVDRARLGIRRTFQRMELFDELNVIENVLVTKELAGRHSLLTGLFRGVHASPGLMSDAEEVLAYLGLLHLAQAPVGALSTGQRRLLELGRVLISDASLVLLDEPSSGLDRSETERFNEIVLGIRRSNPDCSVLLVEHDMTVALGIADDVYVLNFGKMIASGNPAEIRQDEMVRAAYLGGEGS